MMKAATTRFWEPGFSIFTDELAKEERARLTPLEEKMKKTDDPVVKARLKEEISKIKAEFREKRKNARRSLFARS
jgi:hypothetical protein